MSFGPLSNLSFSEKTTPPFDPLARCPAPETASNVSRRWLARVGTAITYNEHLAHDGPAVFEHIGEGYAGLARRRAARAHSLPPSSRRSLSLFPIGTGVPGGRLLRLQNKAGAALKSPANLKTKKHD